MFGILIALWYELLFIIVWIFYSITYPLVYISILLPLLLHPSATVDKYYYMYNSIKYILFCRDKKKKSKYTKNVSVVGEIDHTDPSVYFPGYNSTSSVDTILIKVISITTTLLPVVKLPKKRLYSYVTVNRHGIIPLIKVMNDRPFRF